MSGTLYENVSALIDHYNGMLAEHGIEIAIQQRSFKEDVEAFNQYSQHSLFNLLEYIFINKKIEEKNPLRSSGVTIHFGMLCGIPLRKSTDILKITVAEAAALGSVLDLCAYTPRVVVCDRWFDLLNNPLKNLMQNRSPC